MLIIQMLLILKFQDIHMYGSYNQNGEKDHNQSSL